ncbi:MAG: cytochrome P450, partial [Phaeodactylibacter sp.]|nr:cytochrome P450 [Phaeodactylibacter sp.]
MNESTRTLKQLPSPPGHFLLGHLPEFRRDRQSHRVLEKWAKECGDLYRIHFAGQGLLVSLNPDFNGAVLALRPETFTRLRKLTGVIREMGVVGAFNAEGEVWRQHRPPVSSALNVRKIRAFFPILQDKTTTLIRRLDQLALEAKPIPIQRECSAFTIDVTTAIAFGYHLDRINQQDDAFQQHLEVIFPMISRRVTTSFPYWRFYKSRQDRKLDAALQFVERTVHDCIAAARQRLADQPELQEKPGNLLEMLLTNQSE